jgi:hypothetical protein
MSDPEQLKGEADTAFRAGKLAEARELYEAALSLRPDRMARSPLCDGATYTQNFERACRIMWERWCRGDNTSPILAKNINRMPS